MGTWMDRLESLWMSFDRALGIFDPGRRGGFTSPDDVRSARLLGISTGAMFVVGLVYFLHYWSLGIDLMCVVLAAAVTGGVANLMVMRRTRRPVRGAHIGLAILGTVLLASNLTSGGFGDPSFAWFYILPICAAVVLDFSGAAIWIGVTLVLTVGIWALPQLGVEVPNLIPVEARAYNALLDRVSSLLGIGLVAASFVAGQRRSERALSNANEEISRESAYVQLMVHAAMSANEAASFEAAMQDGMRRICETMGWIVGHIFNVRDDGSIVSSGSFHAPDPQHYEGLRECTESLTYAPGEGLPGRVAKTRQPECICDLRLARGLRQRADFARDAGLRSAFAVPILVNGEVRSVLEFASTETLPMDDRLKEVFAHIGNQLGRVAERTQLEERVRQSQKMEAVGQLAAGLAHEINNPMSYVKSNLHALAEYWDEVRSKSNVIDDDSGMSERFDDCRELLDDSLDGVERTIAIVRDVNELSHAGGGRPEDWSLTPLGDVLDGALRVASFQASPGVQIESDFRDAPEVRCSPNQLAQVFVNLIINAVHAVGESGRIGISVELADTETIVRVEDDGPGIPSEVRERLFDPFFTTKAVGKGTGLGLYVSYEIVRRHGGEVVVHSEDGRGTTFEVHLPRVAPTG